MRYKQVVIKYDKVYLSLNECKEFGLHLKLYYVGLVSDKAKLSK